MKGLLLSNFYIFVCSYLFLRLSGMLVPKLPLPLVVTWTETNLVILIYRVLFGDGLTLVLGSGLWCDCKLKFSLVGGLLACFNLVIVDYFVSLLWSCLGVVCG